jgi:hypothetical protein
LHITAGHKRSAENRSTNYQFKTKVNMKNKTSILVGTRHFFYALLVAVIFCGCGNETTKQETVTVEENKGRIIYDYGWNTKVRVFEVDSCEYIGFDAGTQGGTSIIHKQNCKFCAERSKK